MNSNKIYRGHLVKKHLGQNFLIDQCMVNSIIAAINPQRDQAIVEIGPGLAALTKPICKYLDQLTVIELDHNLAARLQADRFLKSKLTIYQDNVMTINFSKLSKKLGQPLRIFGNLPYNISTLLIFHLFTYSNVITDMHFMLQKEVADRLVARPSTKEYGRLSVMAQYHCQVIPLIKLSSNSFMPQPKVDSVVVRLVPHTTMPYQVKDIDMLNYITMQAFNKRRKIISNSLANLFKVETLTALLIDPTMRAENISVEQYCQMADYISDNRYPKRGSYV